MNTVQFTLAEKIYLSKLLYPKLPIREGISRIDGIILREDTEKPVVDILKGFRAMARVFLGADYDRIKQYVLKKIGKAKDADVGFLDAGFSVYGLISRVSFIKRTLIDADLSNIEKAGRLSWTFGVSPKVRMIVEKGVKAVGKALVKDYEKSKWRFVFGVVGFFLGMIVESKLFNLFMRAVKMGWSKVEAFLKMIWNKTVGKFLKKRSGGFEEIEEVA